MPTTRTVTVKSSGGDYATLSAAIAGESKNLVALDRQLTIECYNFQDTTVTTISGFTTDATRFLKVTAVDRHDGKWNTSAYRLVTAGIVDAALTVIGDNIFIEGLQVNHNQTNYGCAIGISGAVVLDGCLVTNAFNSGNAIVGSGISVSGSNAVIRNCIIFKCVAGYGIYINANNTQVQNCTIVNCGYGVGRQAGTATFTNCYVGGMVLGAEYSTDNPGLIAKLTCAHSSATVRTNSTASIAYSTANFINVTASTEDLHLQPSASSTLLTGGTNLSGTFTNDIDNGVRTTPWTIGADSLVSVATSTVRICKSIISGGCTISTKLKTGGML